MEQGRQTLNCQTLNGGPLGGGTEAAQEFRGYVGVAPSKRMRIATLGPAGTSSEVAAYHLAGVLLGRDAVVVEVDLYPSFEDSAEAVRSGHADLVVVANAYHNANEIYMHPEMMLVGAYLHDTPEYGLAARAGDEVSGVVVVVSHPAPLPLLRQLFADGVEVRDVHRVSSTSEAARLVAEGDFDLALTNRRAADAFGLTFRSPTRRISMSWAVFAPRPTTLVPCSS